jgi:hypothetical protein
MLFNIESLSTRALFDDDSINTEKKMMGMGGGGRELRGRRMFEREGSLAKF